MIVYKTNPLTRNFFKFKFNTIYVFPLAAVSHVKPKKFFSNITKQDLETAVRVAADQVAKLATFENNIQDSGIRIEESSPMYGQMIDFLPSDEAINNTKNAFIAMKASQQLASKYCLR